MVRITGLQQPRTGWCDDWTNDQAVFSHMFGGKTYQVDIDLADKLAEMVPVDNAQPFLVILEWCQRHSYQNAALLL